MFYVIQLRKHLIEVVNMDLSNLTLYHGAYELFDEIDTSKFNRFRYFGAGFYLTSKYDQAFKWGKSLAERHEKDNHYIYTYRISNYIPENMRIKELLDYDKEWLDYIVQNRFHGGSETPLDNYDIVYDKMADNRSFMIASLIAKYHNGEIPYNNVISKIKWKRDTKDQYCFKTDLGMSVLQRIDSKVFYLNGDSYDE